jgi:hypothetical protein
MTRNVRRNVIALAISLFATLAITAAVAQAKPAAQVCRAFKQGGLTFNSETLGTRWTCASAKKWIAKLSRDKIRHSTSNVRLSNGPKGYHCFAEPSSQGGRATAGTCFTGTIAYPGTGFAWFEA